MSARWWVFAVWALVAASAAAWGLKLFGRGPGVPAQAQLAQAGDAPAGDWARVLGADAPPPPVQAAVEAAPAAADARFSLLGVLSARPSGPTSPAVALIAVDGKPARAYRIGSAVDNDWVLQSVGPRSATLGPRGGGSQVSLSLPPPAEAVRGSLPPAGAPGGAVGVPPMPPGTAPALVDPPPAYTPPVVPPQPGMVPGMPPPGTAIAPAIVPPTPGLPSFGRTPRADEGRPQSQRAVEPGPRGIA